MHETERYGRGIAIPRVLSFATFALAWYSISALARFEVSSDLLLSEPLATTDESEPVARVREESCHSFEIPINQDSSEYDCFCRMRGWYGRLGNRLSTANRLIDRADTLSCGVYLRKDLLSGWKPRVNKWRFVDTNSSDDVKANNTCETLRAREVFSSSRNASTSSACRIRLLKDYFMINQTHAFGKPCPAAGHVGLHVRSGDVARGSWSENETFSPGKVHHKYWLYPTAFYMSVIREVRARRGDAVNFYVFCETLGNPTCEFFKKLSVLDKRVRIRVGQPLINDLAFMLCASEMAESHGTFKKMFAISSLEDQIRHRFSFKPEYAKSCSQVWHWITAPNQYRKVVFPWKNTGFQRHEVNNAYDMDHSHVPC